MRRRAISIVFAIFIFAIMVLFPTVSAHSDGLLAIITVEDKEHSTGDEATVQVHLYHNADPVDADEEPLLEFDVDMWDDTEGREITTTKKDTGLYEGKVKIFDSDLQGDDSGAIYLMDTGETPDDESYTITHGIGDENNDTYDYLSSWDTSYNYIRLDTQAGLSIDFEFKDLSEYPWGPGDTIEFKVFVTDAGEKVEPDDFEIEAWGDSDSLDVPYDNPSTGVYDADFQIPSDLEDATDFSIIVTAELGEKKTSGATYIDVDIYSIWFHQIKKDSTKEKRVFEIFVADLEGEPVNGATVDIFYYAGPGFGSYHTTKEVTTIEGSVMFTVEDVQGDVDISGLVSKDDADQYFYGTLVYGERADVDDIKPNPFGFDVETITDTFEIKDGKVTHEFVAFHDEETVYMKDIYYYAYTPYEVLTVGKATTNGVGEFTLQIDAPSKEDVSIEVTFKAEFGYHPGIFQGYDWEDSDWDGFSDNFEEYVETDPDDDESFPQGYTDSDGDQYGDEFELNWGDGTDPFDALDFPRDYNDTDHDGFGDEFEIQNGTDPENMWDHPSETPDNDNDGHSNDEEQFYKTNPNNNKDYPRNTLKDNTDNDQVNSIFWGKDEQYDCEERFYGTDPDDNMDYPFDPYKDDSDGDGVCDEEEIFYGTDPNNYSDSPDTVPSPWDERWADHNSTDGWLYEKDSVYLSPVYDLDEYLSDDRVEIEVKKFTIGGQCIVTLDSKEEGAYYYAAWGYGNLDEQDMISPTENNEWECWSKQSIDMYPMAKNYQGVIVAPDFLPKDKEYYIVGGYSDGSDFYLNHVQVSDGDSAKAGGEKKVDGGVSAILVIIIIAVILLLVFGVIALVVIVLVMKKKGKKADDKGDKRPLPPPPPDEKRTPPPPPPPPPE